VLRGVEVVDVDGAADCGCLAFDVGNVASGTLSFLSGEVAVVGSLAPH